MERRREASIARTPDGVQCSAFERHVTSRNHHHLFHFWMVVREGGVTRASEKLNVSQPTVSGQLRELQQALGEKLLIRSGRTVVLTDVGRTVYRYADEIFTLGLELQAAVKGRVTHPARLAVGVTMVVPRLVVGGALWTAALAAGVIGSAVVTAVVRRKRPIASLAQVIAGERSERVVVPARSGTSSDRRPEGLDAVPADWGLTPSGGTWP